MEPEFSTKLCMCLSKSCTSRCIDTASNHDLNRKCIDGSNRFKMVMNESENTVVCKTGSGYFIKDFVLIGKPGFLLSKNNL